MVSIKTLSKIIAILGLTVFVCTAAVTPSINTQNNILTNYPNPFDSRTEVTTIIYSLSSTSEVKLTIYDLLGYPVREFASLDETSGIKKIVWDGTNEEGLKVGKGGYICVLEICNGSIKTLSTRKIGVIH